MYNPYNWVIKERKTLDLNTDYDIITLNAKKNVCKIGIEMELLNLKDAIEIFLISDAKNYDTIQHDIKKIKKTLSEYHEVCEEIKNIFVEE